MVHFIINSIKSIKKYVTDVLYEIIVVDNNSQDSFREILYNEFGNKIICISLKENKGFGLANNEGIKIAKGRNVLFLNPDTLLLNNAIKQLSDYLDNNKSVGCCGGNLYNENLQPTHSYGMLFPSMLWELMIVEKILYRKSSNFNTTANSIKVSYITGADLMIKAEILNAAGMFSDKYFMYYEETDLCFRIHKMGYKLMSVPSAKIQHLEAKSFESNINKKKLLYMEQGRQTFYSLHYSSIYVNIVNLIYYCALCIRICLFYFIDKKRYNYCKIRKSAYIQVMSTN
jgi:GT2 family glycosyltransferase